MENKIPYGKQFLSDDDKCYVTEVLNSDFLTCGPKVKEFEDKLCEISGAEYAVSCSNGTAALHLACLALGVNNKTKAVTSPITFLSSANCVEFCRGNVDFIDINPDTLCLDEKKLEERCNGGNIPDVVIPVDFAGVPANLPKINKLSEKFGFKIIEDAAHSIGSKYLDNDKEYSCGCCAHTDLAIFSFHPVKTITTGEGGAVLTNDKDLYEKLVLYRNHGMTKDPDVLNKKSEGPWYYEMHELGYNYRITDIQCALGINQLKQLKNFKKRRKEISNRYMSAFSNNDKVVMQLSPAGTDPCFHLFTVQFVEGPEKRKLIYYKLREKGILTQIHYYPIYLQPYYKNKYGYTEGKCPNAEKYYSSCLSLPLYPAMTDNQVEFVIKSLMELL